MNFQDVYKKIAEDTNYLFANMANALKYDKTFRAKVIGQESTGKYKILYKNVEYTAKCDGRLNVGDLVWTCAPRNDWNELYIQQGYTMQNQVNQTNSNLNDKASISALNAVSADIQKIKSGAMAEELTNNIKDYNYNTPISIAIQNNNLYINDGNKIYYVPLITMQ